MKKILKIFVVGAIAALLGIIIGCSAFAADFSKEAFDAGFVQVNYSANPVGTVLNKNFNVVDSKSGLTGHELLRNSIYQDISYSMDLMISGLGKYDYEANATFGISSMYTELARDFTQRGLLFYNDKAIGLKIARANNITAASSSHPGLTVPSTNWARFCEHEFAEDIISDKDATNIFVEGHNWLVFTVNNAQYSYELKGNQSALLKEVRAALFEAYLPYSFAIYEYAGANDVSKLSATELSDKNLVLSYFIHPLVGVIPCNLDNNGTLKIIDSYTDYASYFYGSTDAMYSYSEIAKSFISMYSDFSDTKAVLIGAGSTDRVKGAGTDFYKAQYNCFFMGVSEIEKFMYANGTTYSVYGFNLHPDYMTWALKMYSRNNEDVIDGYLSVSSSLDTKLTNQTSNGSEKQFVHSLNYTTRSGSMVSMKATKLIHTMYPVVTISEWKSSDVFGIYSAYDLLEKGYSSRLSVYLGKSGYRSEYKDTGKFFYKQLFGSATGASYITGYGGKDAASITLGTNTVDIAKSTLTRSFYIDISTGKLYTVGNCFPCQYLLCSTSNTLSYNFGNSFMTFASGNLLYNYVEFSNPVDLGNLYISRVNGITYPGFYCSGASKSPSDGENHSLEPAALFDVVIPSVYGECIRDNWTLEYSNATGQKTKTQVTFYVSTGRKVSFNFDNAISMDLANMNGVVKYTNSDSAASGLYFSSTGRVSTANTSNISMTYIMLKDGPSIVLSSDYIQESGLLNWLETSSASAYMSNNVKYSGYTADLLYKRLTSKGVTLNPGASEDEQARYDDIASELSGNNANSVLNIVLTFISFMGLILMVYACALVIAYYIDIFNTVSDVSILNIITFGNCRAVHSKEDLADLGITDPKEKRKYCTQFSIIGRWALTMGFGILLFASNQVYISILRLYMWLTSLVG